MKQLQMMDEHMARVPKVHFAEASQLSYDVYVRLSADHFIMVGRSGTQSTIHRLKAFETDLVPWFYILKGDYPRYVEQTVSHATIQATAQSDRAQLLESVGQSMSSIYELTRVGGFVPTAWKATEKLADVIYETILQRPAVSQLLVELQRLGELNVRHAVGVSLLATLIAKELGGSAADLKAIASAGLLHDIGFIKMPEEVTNRREDLFNAEQRSLYENHPHLGAKMVRECASVPAEVSAMIYDHHENVLGTGFPRRLPGDKVPRAAMILGLAERFCELTVGDSLHQEFLSAHAAINTISTIEGRPYPIEWIRLLERFLRRG